MIDENIGINFLDEQQITVVAPPIPLHRRTHMHTRLDKFRGEKNRKLSM